MITIDGNADDSQCVVGEILVVVDSIQRAALCLMTGQSIEVENLEEEVAECRNC